MTPIPAEVEAAAKILADWIGYGWDGLDERDISSEFPDWAYDGAMHLHMQGGKPVLRKVAAAMLRSLAAQNAVIPSAGGGW